MFNRAILAKILADKETRKVPIGCQSTMIHAIERVLESMGYDFTESEGDYAGILLPAGNEQPLYGADGAIATVPAEFAKYADVPDTDIGNITKWADWQDCGEHGRDYRQ